MRITVLAVTLGPPTLVSFSASSGEGRGTWCGRAAPVAGLEVDVELDLSLPFVPSGRATGITREAGDTRIVGILEARDEDGVAYLRLSRDALSLVEVSGEVDVGAVVEVLAPPDALRLTPIGG